jgi:hypothetical protein
MEINLALLALGFAPSAIHRALNSAIVLLNSPACRLTGECPEPLSSRTTADLPAPAD